MLSNKSNLEAKIELKKGHPRFIPGCPFCIFLIYSEIISTFLMASILTIFVLTTPFLSE